MGVADRNVAQTAKATNCDVWQAVFNGSATCASSAAGADGCGPSMHAGCVWAAEAAKNDLFDGLPPSCGLPCGEFQGEARVAKQCDFASIKSCFQKQATSFRSFKPDPPVGVCDDAKVGAMYQISYDCFNAVGCGDVLEIMCMLDKPTLEARGCGNINCEFGSGLGVAVIVGVVFAGIAAIAIIWYSSGVMRRRWKEASDERQRSGSKAYFFVPPGEEQGGGGGGGGGGGSRPSSNNFGTYEPPIVEEGDERADSGRTMSIGTGRESF